MNVNASLSQTRIRVLKSQSLGMAHGAIWDFKALIRVWFPEPKQKSLTQYTESLPRVYGI